MPEEHEWPNYDDDPGDDEIDEMAEAEMNCGQDARGGCRLAGTEWCDWSCPFSDELYRKMHRASDKPEDAERDV